MYKNLFIVLNILISMVLSIIFANFSVIIVNFIMLFMLILLIRKEDIYKHLTIIYLICIIAMVSLYFGYIAKYKQPYYLGGSDDANFEIWANRAIKSNNYTIKDINENKEFKFYNCNGFIWFVSMVIRFCNLFGGYHTIVIRLINIYLLIFMGILVFKYFCKEIANKNKDNIFILYLTILFPNALYISIHGFRDTLFAFIIFSIFYLIMNIKEQKKMSKVISIIYIIIVSYLAYHIRSAGIIYIAVIIILNFVLNKKKINNKKTILMFILFIFLCMILIMKFNLVEKVEKYSNRYNEYIVENADGLSKFVFSIPIIPFGIILRVVYGNIYPSPTGILLTNFDVDSICKFIISLGTVLQVYMLPYLLKNLKKIDSLFIMYILIFFSIILTTFGFRHFIILYPFMFILIGRELIKTEKEKRKKCIKVVTILILLGVCIYLINEII